MDSDNYKMSWVKIDKITFNDGSHESFKDDDIVLLVGANNVGKSRILKDIRDDLNEMSNKKVIATEIEFIKGNFVKERLIEYCSKKGYQDNLGNYEFYIDNSTYSYGPYNFNDLENGAKYFYKILFTYLSTENRLVASKPVVFGTQIDNNNLAFLRGLEEDSDAISNLNKNLEVGFHQAIEIDQCYLGNTLQKAYRIGKSSEINEIIKTNKRDSFQKLKALGWLHEQGDGIRSAFAILASLIVNEHSLFLIDEPESFLHPPQAKMLGNQVMELSKGKQCFISTHNIDFIRGILEKDSSRVKIIKLDRQENTNSIKLVDNGCITKLANDKNLKYTNILNGLFYECIVLCENESDCKFYSAILEHLNSDIYHTTLFCGVGGKDQFKKIIPLLKKIGIKFYVISDIDMINDVSKLEGLVNSIEEKKYEEIKNAHRKFLDHVESSPEFENKLIEDLEKEISSIINRYKNLECPYIPDEGINEIKKSLKKSTALKRLKKDGRKFLSNQDCENLFDKIIQFLKNIGIYVLECGEIECLIPSVSSHGESWVNNVFNHYTDLDDPIYNDARQFISQIFNINNSM